MRLLILLFALSLNSAVALSAAADASKPAQRVEGLSLDWPDDEGWAVASHQENQDMMMVEIVRKGETLDNWTQIGTMASYKGVRLADIRVAYDTYAAQFRKSCPDVRLAIQVLEATVEFPRVIFLQECAKTPKDGHPEAALWLAVQGKESLYIAHRAVKADKLADALRSAWVTWLLTGQVVRR